MNKYPKISILGFEIHKITYKDLILEIENFIKEKTPHTIVLLNPHLILEARKRPEYTNYIKNADIVTADGFGLLLAAKLLGDSFPERVTGTDLMYLIGEISQKKKYKIFLLGGKPGVAEKAKQKYEEKFPGINIVGIHHGYFSEDEESKIVNEIKMKAPDILIVCMGAYKQEMFIKKYINELNVPLCFGNGAALDFVSERLKRAPKWMQKIGLEWFWRLIQEPKRLWKRYLIGNTIFIFLVLEELIKKILGKRND
ncbi:MAG: WecB/TagA/CpsF family glycosyltransferase [Candidatus Aenigmatarchaeota archaeon]